MPCPKHNDELEGRSDLECEDCYLADKAEEAHMRQLYDGEVLAGLHDPDKDKEDKPWLYPGPYYLYR